MNEKTKEQFSDEVDKLADEAVSDIGAVFADAMLVNRRNEVKIIVLSAFSKLLGLTRNTLNN